MSITVNKKPFHDYFVEVTEAGWRRGLGGQIHPSPGPISKKPTSSLRNGGRFTSSACTGPPADRFDPHPSRSDPHASSLLHNAQIMKFIGKVERRATPRSLDLHYTRGRAGVEIGLAGARSSTTSAPDAMEHDKRSRQGHEKNASVSWRSHCGV